ncbi:ABC transporter substrate-binding protein [Sphaerochaeta sp. PS]|uniref:ABC transporter substrate-binding protein n=1 Tax=Sphaerochaeta sp. PS TaxID=3076336 RepID=UPI0028A3F989|nr:ABC transporter substrate-binding protein [Sphaerochaeta sp. PS]MDT4761588.1 ABC transporter substrate-binding protein [Sphaerochaeta sp. PS]
MLKHRRSLLLVLLVIVGLSTILTAQPLMEKKNQGPDTLRIVSLSPNVTETLFALGAGDLLAGRTDYCNYPQEAEKLPSIGTLYNPSLEKLISLQPDLAISSAFVSDEMLQSLEKAGIEVLALNEQETFAGTYSLIRKIAQRVNKVKEGELLILEMQNQVKETVEKARLLEKKRVYFMVDFGSFDSTATGDTYISEMLHMVGAINIAQDATRWTYSKELLVTNDPDLIVMTARWGESEEETRAEFSTTKPYSDLRATKEGNLVFVDSDTISRQGPRSAEALELLAKAVHGKDWL